MGSRDEPPEDINAALQKLKNLAAQLERSSLDGPSEEEIRELFQVGDIIMARVIGQHFELNETLCC